MLQDLETKIYENFSAVIEKNIIMIQNPLVSVLIIAYNHENYIAETINSVIAQKCSFNFEIIVSDDCSTDNTLNIIKILQLKHPNLIKIISNKHNLGVNISFLNAVKSAKGDYIASLGGDDYWIVENKLEMQVQMLLSHKEITFVHTEFKSFNESDKIIKKHNNKDWCSILMRKTGKEALVAMLCHNWTGYPLGSSSCYHKDPLLKGINKHLELLNFNLAGEGTFLHTSMSYYGGLYAFIPIQTTMYRIRKKSLSHYESKTEQFDYQKRYFLLRLLAAESYSLVQNEIRRIQKRGMFELFQTAIKLDTINEFQIFLQTQSQDNKNKWCYGFLLNMIKFKMLRYVYRVILKCVNTFQYKFKKNLYSFLYQTHYR